MRVLRAVLMAMSVLAASSRVMPCPAAERSAAILKPVVETAFAAVRRHGKPYPPLYANYVAPHALLERDVVYTAYQDGEGRPMIGAYDIKRRSWLGPIRASEWGLGADTHGNPSICADRKGYLHVFFGCHSGELKHVRSARPRDIRRWVEMPGPTPRATYPQSMRMADGSIYLFYRAGGHRDPWSMRISRDDGKTWSGQQPIVEYRRDFPDKKACSYHAFVPGADHKTVHCFWVYKDDDPKRNKRKHQGLCEAVYRYNIYYAKRTAEGKWIAADGTEMIDLPVNKTFCDKHARIFDSGDEFAGPTGIAVGPDDTPYIRFKHGVRDWKTGKTIVPEQHKLGFPAKGKWKVIGDADMPGDWPQRVKRQLLISGAPAFGGPQPNPWFIQARKRPRGKSAAAYIWLGHVERGYAVRKGGPGISDVKEHATLPKILIVGDSLSVSYARSLESTLKGKALIVHANRNVLAGEGQDLSTLLHQWLANVKWDAIHFSYGPRGTGSPDRPVIPLKQYDKDLAAVLSRFTKTPAKLVFATTIRAGATQQQRREVEAYNRAALRIVKKHKTPVNDLYAFALPRAKKLRDPKSGNLTPEGMKMLAAEVAKHLLRALDGKRSPKAK